MYDEHVVFDMHDVPFETQVGPQSKHYVVEVPYAIEHYVYNAHWAVTVPVAGNQPQFPSVPIIQLAYMVVTAHPVIAMQVVPLVVQSGDTC